MARPESLIKLGYFKTPLNVVQALAPWFTPPAGFWRGLDPCCGTGEALAVSTAAIGGTFETLGVELAPARADAATQVLTHVHHTAWRSMHLADQSVSYLWLNPPYSPDPQEQRLELEFLRTSLGALVYGGALVYIVPQYILDIPDVFHLLAGNFTDLRCLRFPDSDYGVFKQVVVLGQRRKYQTPTKEALGMVRAWATAALPPLDTVPPTPYALPGAPETCRCSRYGGTVQQDIAAAYVAGWDGDLLAAISRPPVKEFTKPAHPLKRGHLIMGMAGDLYGSVRVVKHGQPVLLRGRALKSQRVTRKEEDDGTVTEQKRDIFTTTVGVIDGDGARLVHDEAGLTRFMEDYGDELADRILQEQPLYNLDPTPVEWAHVSQLALTRPVLPGASEPGLLPAQKHLAIANARALARYGLGLIQGEPGLGKTITGIAALDLANAYPALVLCPPHLVDKWRRELETVPGVQTRELRRLGKLASDPVERNDVAEFIRDYRAGQLGQKAVAVVAYTAARDGGGYGPGVATRYTLSAGQSHLPFMTAVGAYRQAQAELHGLRLAAQVAAVRDDLPGLTAQLAAAEAQLPEAAADTPAAQARYDTLTAQVAVAQVAADEQAVKLAAAQEHCATLRKAALTLATSYAVCPHCGRSQHDDEGDPLTDRDAFKDIRYCNNVHPYPGWATDEDGAREWQWDRRGCAAPLFDFGQGRYRKWPVADYIADYAPEFFQLLIADEVHEAKSQGTDVGYAFYDLARSIPQHLLLSGTTFGGYSTSLFHLLYRVNAGTVRKLFGYQDAKAWAEKYGVMFETVTHTPETDEHGKTTGKARTKTTRIERPGVAPTILEQLLYFSFFINLADLGISLPPYTEEAVMLDMTAAQAAEYADVDTRLQERMADDPRYLSLWLETLLRRPNSGFRAEQVLKTFPAKLHRESDLVCVLPPVVTGKGLLPKEEWLVNYVAAEAAAGRKALVFARHTGEWDIQPRLVSVLEGAGLRALALPNTVQSRQREAWLHGQTANLDALIVNPEKVKTGLDLVMFSDVVFYELTYNLYTLWQAMRRVWRFGQTEPVKVSFAAYRNTVEARALSLMGAKMAAAQRLYGDSVAGVIVQEEDCEGSFLMELAQQALAGREIRPFLQLFGNASGTTASPMGSPTRRSPLIRRTVAELWAQVQAGQLAITPQRRGRKTVSVPSAQPTLLGF